MLSNTFRYPACVLCLTMILVFAAYGQTTAEPDEATVKAVVMGMALFQQGHYIESLPFLETAVKGMPNEPKLRFIYGFALVAKSKQVSNSEEGKQLSAKALEQFKTAKQLGLEDEANDEFIRILSGGPRSDLAKASHMYSQNDEADKLTAEGEDLFAQSKYDEALKKYEKALSIDPKIYQAALAGGDCYTQKSDWDNAEKWYQRAIAIDPNRETAYRRQSRSGCGLCRTGSR